MKIFVYDGETTISADARKHMEANGYILLRVKDVTRVRIIDPVVDADASVILRAALRAIRDTVDGEVRQRFGRHLANLLEPMPKS